MPATASSRHRQPNGPVDNRARLVKLVHVGRRELGLGEESYRTILRQKGEADSASNMNAAQLQRVVDYMKTLGFKVTSKAKAGAPARPVKLADDAQSRKARAMWLTLHAIGQVRDPSEAALQAYAQRQTGAQRLEWVSDMVPVLEPLKAWLLRSLPGVVLPYLQRPVMGWAGHMQPAWLENWTNAVSSLGAARQSGKVQIVDEWVSLWELISSATAGGQR
jgi:phage gp16-like protein